MDFFQIGDEVVCEDGDFEGELGYVTEVYKDSVLVDFEDEEGVEIPKEDLMKVGTCEGCGSIGYIGNACTDCEDSGYIYS